MPRERKILRTIINAVAFILMELTALFLLSRQDTVQKLWAAKLGHGFQMAVWGTSRKVTEYFSLRRQNEALAVENFRLHAALSKMAKAGRDSVITMPEFGPTQVAGFSFLPAEIVQMSGNGQHNYLIINKGAEDGVQINSGIMTSLGVVGIINAVDRHYAYGLSFKNKDVSVSARLGNDGAVAPLTWDGLSGSGAILSDVSLQYKFSPGDTVWTSGFSAIFPPDIPLGTTGESEIVNGSTLNVKVRLFQDFATLRYVTVVNNTDMQEIRGLEGIGLEEGEAEDEE